MTVRILTGDCRDMLRTLLDESVHCVVTSPPYWGLRDYGVDGQLGLERSLGEHIAVMVEVFREVRRVLRKDGTLWLNYGDSYATTPNGRPAADVVNDDRTFRDKPVSTVGPIYIDADAARRRGRSGNLGNGGGGQGPRHSAIPDGRIAAGGYLKPKDLCGIPWRIAFALQDDGWYLRQDIIWAKPNPMPESIRDRCTKAHEYLFLLAKSPRYFFDQEAIREDIKETCDGSIRAPKYDGGIGNRVKNGARDQTEKLYSEIKGANRRSVWTIATAPFSEAHFATFPPALIEPCIKAGTSERGCCAKCGAPWVRQIETTDTGRKQKMADGWDTGEGGHGTVHRAGREKGESDKAVTASITVGWSPSCKCDAPTVPCAVLDCFGGAGTTGLVADRLQRSAILIELNPAYAEMARKRIEGDAPLFAAVDDYDPADDVTKCFEEAYRVIRERVAAGGKPWKPRVNPEDQGNVDKNYNSRYENVRPARDQSTRSRTGGGGEDLPPADTDAGLDIVRRSRSR